MNERRQDTPPLLKNHRGANKGRNNRRKTGSDTEKGDNKRQRLVQGDAKASGAASKHPFPLPYSLQASS